MPIACVSCSSNQRFKTRLFPLEFQSEDSRVASSPSPGPLRAPAGTLLSGLETPSLRLGVLSTDLVLTPPILIIIIADSDRISARFKSDTEISWISKVTSVMLRANVRKVGLFMPQ